MRGFPSLVHLASGALWVALGRFIRASLRARTALAAANLFLRKQLARSRERQVKARRASDATRLGMVLLARCFAWKEALTIVQPATLIHWHRKGFKFFWRWRSASRGRPRVPTDLRTLIGRMAEENPTWGQRGIAAELRLKLGLRMSPRTVRRLWCAKTPSVRLCSGIIRSDVPNDDAHRGEFTGEVRKAEVFFDHKVSQAESSGKVVRPIFQLTIIGFGGIEFTIEINQ